MTLTPAFFYSSSFIVGVTTALMYSARPVWGKRSPVRYILICARSSPVALPIAALLMPYDFVLVAVIVLALQLVSVCR